MSKKLVAVLLAAIFLLAIASSAFSQTEDEIVAQYLKKVEKRHRHRIYFMDVSFAYGKLPNDNPYNSFYNYANSNIAGQNGSSNPLTGIWRSKEFGANFGLMVSRNMSFKFGFKYWHKLGNSVVGDYNFGIAPLGLQENFDLKSEVQVYGFTGGIDCHILNPPNREGIVNSLALRIGAGGGIYMVKWDIWEGSNSFNLSADLYEETTEPLKGSAPGFSAWVGADYPIGVFDLLVGTDIIYQHLNFDNVHSYNNLGEELYVIYSDNTADRVTLDFSGLRGKIELKKYFQW